ncbi:methyltransferase [Lentzea sp. NBRC 105346]|uniref:class I SAM-dependent methyltransferase n=1 Tax=Lentzea sp. NBRC 105346 TaxID=3032205 RepID=UPI0024A0548D|nr:class I SAM-dependent methyltransferase [Lentzea sp. NBRC 105346]GLZ29402.1 methyltransferase [Lentzea sp. NBRC 105346]
MDSHDVWAVGNAYERYMGRWSRPVAQEFVRWLPAAGSWLDVGCGTGVLTALLPNATGVDASEGFLVTARERVPGATFLHGDAQALPLPDNSFDAVVSGLTVNFVPDPAAAAAEFARVTRGLAAAYVWDFAEGMELIRIFWEVAAELDPAAVELDEGRRFPLCRPEKLAELWAGFRDVEVRAIDVPTTFRDFDDYWSPFLGGQGPAPGYVMSLPEEHRTALKERLRERLGDGEIRLTARAWAVRGSV